MLTSSIDATPVVIPPFTKFQTTQRQKEDVEEEGLSNQCKELLASLPREKGWRTRHLYHFQGFWCQPKEIQAIISFQKHFKSTANDIILATIPKSGTTWLKALTFTVVKRRQFPVLSNDHPLLTSNPHDLVPFFEYKLYANHNVPDLSSLPSPRTFATHIPLPCLKKSIKKSDTKVVYLCRNPFDTLISSRHYVNKIKPESVNPISLDEGFDLYCKGIIGFGPFWKHMLGYWKESLKRPDRVLFLKYEDLKQDIRSSLKRLADFLGFPLTEEEEKEGGVEAIAKLCSFENLKNLEVNKSGKSIKNFENKYLFRKGEVRDWVNHLSPSQVENLSKLMKEKLGGSGLTFKYI